MGLVLGLYLAMTASWLDFVDKRKHLNEAEIWHCSGLQVVFYHPA